ncbi:hypothetical protein MPNT_170039 [Candidatus Methylacidithermus pantelleriae]|uniref:Uncharacterized protein n=1 Tax=Candidatus Methylacidithermus pantelleriae TaxID=2744239 RepID=A0A8J2FRX2_9BACT|nr:hypothetical protein MPNT_170039 [Candidatus Methylacidithermus pantelleriae]
MKAFRKEVRQTPCSSLRHPRSAAFVGRQIFRGKCFGNCPKKEASYSRNWACFLSFLTGPSGSRREDETINSLAYNNLASSTVEVKLNHVLVCAVKKCDCLCVKSDAPDRRAQMQASYRGSETWEGILLKSLCRKKEPGKIDFRAFGQ